MCLCGSRWRHEKGDNPLDARWCGQALLCDGTPASSFELVSTQAMPSGIILSAYKVAGPLAAG